jgi:hypothetical protein
MKIVTRLASTCENGQSWLGILQALGKLPYPWEESLSAETIERLGFFKPMILKMLSRDPHKRPSLEAVSKEWRGLLSGSVCR